jgi:glycosyltransferase involved in cell wall biosynthesis
MKVLAVVCVRNEAVHVRRCLSDLIVDGIDVILIDNESTDESVKIAAPFLGNGLIAIESLRWTGCFSLSDQLDCKKRIAAKMPHEWVIHADADEWLRTPDPSVTLLEGIARADKAGYNCINFREFVFVALPGEDFRHAEYRQFMRTYYFFEPAYPRLMRAWKRGAEFDNSATGGHLLQGANIRRSHEDFHLRHYLMLSEEHIRKKYMERKFDPADIAKGWHGNRLSIPASAFRVTHSPALRTLIHAGSHDLDTTVPAARHFWQWPAEVDAPPR